MILTAPPRFALLPGLLAAALAAVALAAAEEPSPTTVFAGTDASDPYLWLEDVDGERALNWVRAHNAATGKKLASQPLYQELRREAKAAFGNEDEGISSAAGLALGKAKLTGEQRRQVFRERRLE